MRAVGWVVSAVVACVAGVAQADEPAPTSDPRASCLSDRAARQRAALAVDDLQERARLLGGLPDCGPPPPPPATAFPPPPSRGRPPLSGSRVAKEIGIGLAAEGGAVLLGLVLPCSGSWCGDRVDDAIFFVGPALSIVAMPIAVGLMGNRGDQNGSILLMIAGLQVGALASIGIGQLDARVGVASLYVLPLGFAVTGLNLWRDYDVQPVSSGREVVRWTPTVTRDRDGHTLLGIGGAF